MLADMASVQSECPKVRVIGNMVSSSSGRCIPLGVLALVGDCARLLVSGDLLVQMCKDCQSNPSGCQSKIDQVQRVKICGVLLMQQHDSRADQHRGLHGCCSLAQIKLGRQQLVGNHSVARLPRELSIERGLLCVATPSWAFLLGVDYQRGPDQKQSPGLSRTSHPRRALVPCTRPLGNPRLRSRPRGFIIHFRQN